MVPIGNMRELLTDERAAMEAYKREFIEFMVQSDVLKFGDFTLKSGRKSPFFMNAGAYVTGEQLHRLGLYYAQAINDNFGLDFDVVFGPAYKGIPLAVVTAMALQELYGKEVKYCCNRKEVKDHGADAGNLLGAELTTRTRSSWWRTSPTSGKSIRRDLPHLEGRCRCGCARAHRVAQPHGGGEGRRHHGPEGDRGEVRLPGGFHRVHGRGEGVPAQPRGGRAHRDRRRYRGRHRLAYYEQWGAKE